MPLNLHRIKRATPFAFPLMVERLREKLNTEKLSDRVARMLRDLEKAAERETAPVPRRRAAARKKE